MVPHELSCMYCLSLGVGGVFIIGGKGLKSSALPATPTGYLELQKNSMLVSCPRFLYGALQSDPTKNDGYGRPWYPHPKEGPNKLRALVDPYLGLGGVWLWVAPVSMKKGGKIHTTF